MLRDYLPDNVRRAAESIEWQPHEWTSAFTCATCEDLHMIRFNVPVGHVSFGKMYPCPDCAGGLALMDRQVKSKLHQTELPKEYQGLTFESWDALPVEQRRGKNLALACAKLFVRAPEHRVSFAEAYQMAGRELGAVDVVRNSLIFQGEPGLGKTGLAAAIVNHLLAEGKSVLYIRTQDFVEALKESFDKEKKYGDDRLPASAQEILGMVKRFPRLVLDEFNMNVTGEWRQEQIENVIRYRYGNGLPTILTCNAGPDELERQWGLRTTSVLFTMSHWVPMGGLGLRDMRQSDEVF